MSRSLARRRAVCRIEVPMALNRDGLAGPFLDASTIFFFIFLSYFFFFLFFSSFIPTGTRRPSFHSSFFTVNLYDVDIYTRRGGTGDKRHAHTGSGISTRILHPAGSRRPYNGDGILYSFAPFKRLEPPASFS